MGLGIRIGYLVLGVEIRDQDWGLGVSLRIEGWGLGIAINWGFGFRIGIGNLELGVGIESQDRDWGMVIGYWVRDWGSGLRIVIEVVGIANGGSFIFIGKFWFHQLAMVAG